MKIQRKNLSDNEQMIILDALYTSAGSVRGRDAMKRFLRDLLTESERIMLGRRILIARALMTGSSYDEIVSEMRVGPDTIRRVHIWLEDQIPGYENAIRGLEDEKRKRLNNSQYRKSVLYRLKKKYPLHFLLFPWPKNK